MQPLLQWSWLTFVPLRLAESARRPSLAVGNGQFLVVRRAAYARAGGHAAVRGEVVDDVALARAVTAAGGRVAVVDGTDWATLPDVPRTGGSSPTGTASRCGRRSARRPARSASPRC